MRGVRQGLARGAGHRRAPGRGPGPAGDDRRGRPRRRGADRAPPRPRRRRPGASGAVPATARRRSPVRPGRLRHEGGARLPDVRDRGPSRSGSSARATRDRARRGVGGGGGSRRRSPGKDGLRGRLRDHRRAHGHARGGGGEGGARNADSGVRASRPRGDAVARSERDPARARGLPRDRVATFCEPKLGAVRPAVDQPRPDPGR